MRFDYINRSVEVVQALDPEELRPRLASAKLRKLLLTGAGGVDEAGPHALITMRAGGKTDKIVRFPPAPFTMTYDQRDPLTEAIRRTQRDFSIVLREDSRLAEDLRAHGQTVE